MTTAPTASRAARLAVWVLLVVTVGLGVALTSTGTPPIPADAHAAGELVDAGAPAQPQVLALDGNHPDIPELGRYQWDDDPDEDFATISLLPAWRWSNNTSLFTNFRSGLLDLDPFRGLASGVGSFTFGIAAWLWQGLLAVIAFALTTNVAAHAGEAINRGFNGMFTSLLGSGIFAIVLVLGLVYLIKNILRVRIGQAVRTVLSVLLPLGLLYGLAYTTDGADADPLKPGTPAWIADRGVSWVDQVGVSIGSGFGLIDKAKATLPEGQDQFGLTDTCYAYTAELYGQYDKLAGDTSGTKATSGSSRRLVSTVSLLWQRAFEGPWVTAQYGSPLGHNIACHQLEAQNRVPVAEQLAIARHVDGMPKGGDAADAYRNHPGDLGLTQAGYLAWVACSGTERSQLTEPFDKIEMDGQCETWWNEGTPPGGLTSNKMDNVASATINSDAADDHRDEAEAFFQVYDSLLGGNPAQRMLGGIAAVVTAGIYLWALGGIAVGSILAQVGLVLLLILLPVTLTMLAMPSGKGQRNPMGIKMLKMTGGFFGAKLGLVVVMTLLMQSIVTVEALLNTSGRGAASFLHMLIPLVCVFLVRKLVKAAGFGDITSLTGSLGLATQAAVAAEGGGMMHRRMRTAQAERLGNKEFGFRGRKFGLNRTDALAKRHGRAAAAIAGRTAKGAVTGTGRFALNAAAVIDHDNNEGKIGKALHRAAERTEIRKEALLGAKDEDGNVVSDGVWQRAQSFSGLVGLAQDARRRGSVSEQASADAAEMKKDPTTWQKIAGLDKGNANARSLQQQQARHRKARLDALKNGKGRSVEEIERDLAAKQLAGSAAHKDKLHQELLQEEYRHGDVDQEKRFLSAYKDHVGYGRGAITAAGSALAPFVTPTGEAGVLPEGISETATIRQAAHPVHYLPKEIAQRRKGESDDDYTTRINATLVRKGLLDPETGDTVDYAAINGVDLDSEWGQDQALRASRGESSVLTDGSMTIQFTAADLADIDRTMGLNKINGAELDKIKQARETALEVAVSRKASAEGHRTTAFELSRTLKVKGDELRSAVKVLEAPDRSSDVTAATAKVSELTVEVERMTSSHGAGSGMAEQSREQLAAAREEMATLVKQQTARQDAQRQVDSLKNEIQAMLHVEKDADGKVVAMGDLMGALSEGFKDNKTLESYSVLVDPDMPSGDKAKASKMNDIDAIKHQQALEVFFTEKMRELDVADGQQVLEVVQLIGNKARTETQSLNSGAAAANDAWEKSAYQLKEKVEDRERERERVAADRASRPVRAFVRNMNNGARSLHEAERRELKQTV